MTRFAKLTMSDFDDDTPIWVNPAHVEDFWGDEAGTTIAMIGHDIDVDERPEEVARILEAAGRKRQD